MNLQAVLLALYSAALIVLGLWLGRRVRTSADFFVANRHLGPVLLGSTMLAANIGAGSTVGAAGLAYRVGVSAWWWVGSAGIGSLVLALWVGPRMRREAARLGLSTVGDYLEYRYGREVRGIVAVLLWVATLTILAGQLIAVALILHQVAGVPHAMGAILGGLVMTTYFTAGGLLASAWVNAVQLVVLLAGFIVVIPVAIRVGGGWGQVAAALPGGNFWNIWQGDGSGVMLLAMLGPSFIISPGLLQKVYGARDDRAVRWGVGANAVGLLLFACLPTLLGMVARARFPNLPDPQLALPMMLTRELPAVIGSLGLAAVLSAEISTCDAILFMLATSLSQDLYRRFVNPVASDRAVLNVARGAAIVGGVLGIAIAIANPSIIGTLTIFYTLLTVILFVPVIAGLYSRRVGTPEALSSIGAGLATVLAIQLSSDGRGFGLLTPAVAGLLAALAGFGLTALVRSLTGEKRARTAF